MSLYDSDKEARTLSTIFSNFNSAESVDWDNLHVRWQYVFHMRNHTQLDLLQQIPDLRTQLLQTLQTTGTSDWNSQVAYNDPVKMNSIDTFLFQKTPSVPAVSNECKQKMWMAFVAYGLIRYKTSDPCLLVKGGKFGGYRYDPFPISLFRLCYLKSIRPNLYLRILDRTMDAHLIVTQRQCLPFYQENKHDTDVFHESLANDGAMCQCLSFDIFRRSRALVRQLLWTFSFPLTLNTVWTEEERRTEEWKFLQYVKRNMNTMTEFSLNLELIWNDIRESLQWSVHQSNFQGASWDFDTFEYYDCYNMCRLAYPQLPIYLEPVLPVSVPHCIVIAEDHQPVSSEVIGQHAKPIHRDDHPPETSFKNGRAVLYDYHANPVKHAFDSMQAGNCASIEFTDLRPSIAHAWHQWQTMRPDCKQGELDFCTAYVQGFFPPMIGRCRGIPIKSRDSLNARWNVVLETLGPEPAAFPLGNPFNRFLLKFYISHRMQILKNQMNKGSAISRNKKRVMEDVETPDPTIDVLDDRHRKRVLEEDIETPDQTNDFFEDKNIPEPVQETITEAQGVSWQDRPQQDLQLLASRCSCWHVVRIYQADNTSRENIRDIFVQYRNLVFLQPFIADLPGDMSASFSFHAAKSWKNWSDNISTVTHVSGTYSIPDMRKKVKESTVLRGKVSIVSMDDLYWIIAKVACSPIEVPVSCLVYAVDQWIFVKVM